MVDLGFWFLDGVNALGLYEQPLLLECRESIEVLGRHEVLESQAK